MTTVARRPKNNAYKTIGRGGGRSVGHPILFAPADGSKHPGDSLLIRNTRLPQDPLHQQKWEWALNRAMLEDLWVVVEAPGLDAKQRTSLRAAIHKTARRRGIDVFTCYVEGVMYAKPL